MLSLFGDQPPGGPENILHHSLRWKYDKHSYLTMASFIRIIQERLRENKRCRKIYNAIYCMLNIIWLIPQHINQWKLLYIVKSHIPTGPICDDSRNIRLHYRPGNDTFTSFSQYVSGEEIDCNGFVTNGTKIGVNLIEQLEHGQCSKRSKLLRFGIELHLILIFLMTWYAQ